MGDPPVPAHDELARELPGIVDDGPVRAVPTAGELHAGIGVAAEEGVRGVEHDLGGRALEEAVALVQGTFRIREDRDVETLPLAVARGPLGFARPTMTTVAPASW